MTISAHQCWTLVVIGLEALVVLAKRTPLRLFLGWQTILVIVVLITPTYLMKPCSNIPPIPAYQLHIYMSIGAVTPTSDTNSGKCHSRSPL